MRLRECNKGFSLVEMLVALALLGILTGAAAANLKELNNSLVDGAFQLEHHLRLVRARAISQTIAITVAPSSNDTLQATRSTSCSGTQAPMTDLNFGLPDGARFSDTTWSVCFSQRGLTNNTVDFTLEDEEGDLKVVQVALGGGIKIQ